MPPLLIGTGGSSGVYYPVGGAICRYLNSVAQPGDRQCRIVETQGSLDNLRALHEHRLDLAIVQSDAASMSYLGTSELDIGPMRVLRVLLPLYVEALAILVRADAGIAKFEDLAGKAVNAGPQGSGSSQTFHRLAAAHGFDLSRLGRLDEGPSGDAVEPLCGRELDAMFFVSGHPNALVEMATQKCDLVLLPVAPEVIERLSGQNGLYVSVSVPGGLYHGNSGPTVTIGTQAELVARSDLSDKTVLRVIEGILSDWAGFTREHPALRTFADQIGPGQNRIVPTHMGVLSFLEDDPTGQ